MTWLVKVRTLSGGIDLFNRVTAKDIRDTKNLKDKLAVVTAYDATMASLAEKAGCDVLLVGDSLGMVVLGYENTIPVVMDDMVHHTKAVARGSKKAHIVSDMPFMSFNVSVDETLRNASRLIQEGGAQSVKLEGGKLISDQVKRLVSSGIPVMGHIGLTPQSILNIGGYKVQGKIKTEALKILDDAKSLEENGAYAIVLELMPAPLAKLITDEVTVPTIGIGAGPFCDGQVQVFHDIMGLYPKFVPKHTRQYLNLCVDIEKALRTYLTEVKEGSFPNDRESFFMDAEMFRDIL